MRFGVGGGSRIARGGISVGSGGIRGGVGSGPFSVSGGAGGGGGFLEAVLVLGAIGAALYVLRLGLIALVLIELAFVPAAVLAFICWVTSLAAPRAERVVKNIVIALMVIGGLVLFFYVRSLDLLYVRPPEWQTCTQNDTYCKTGRVRVVYSQDTADFWVYVVAQITVVGLVFVAPLRWIGRLVVPYLLKGRKGGTPTRP